MSAPRHDSAAEQGVLGSMLLERRACEIGAALLTPTDLFDRRRDT